MTRVPLRKKATLDIPRSDQVTVSKDDNHVSAVAPRELLLRLVFEMTLERTRHRALLSYLEKKLGLDFKEYEADFHAIEERDSEAVFAMLMVPRDDFNERFAVWLDQDRARYIVQGRPGPETAADASATKSPVGATKKTGARKRP